jgi:hypothetical protein
MTRTSRSCTPAAPQEVGGEAIGVRPRRRDVVQAQREHGRLGPADPDRQAPRAVVLLEDDNVALPKVLAAGVTDIGDVHGDAGGHGREVLSEVDEAGLEGGAGLVEARLDGADGDPEARGDLEV